MAYSSYYPFQYYPQMQGTQMSLANQQQQSGIIWVQGEAGAKSYLVAPNTTVQLWDSEQQVIYLKSADASGMPSMKILDYTVRDAVAHNKPAETAPAIVYATKEDVFAVKAELDDLKNKMGGLLDD